MSLRMNQQSESAKELDIQKLLERPRFCADSQIYSWNELTAALQQAANQRDRELRTLMDCKHPKACWITIAPENFGDKYAYCSACRDVSQAAQTAVRKFAQDAEIQRLGRIASRAPEPEPLPRVVDTVAERLGSAAEQTKKGGGTGEPDAQAETLGTCGSVLR